MLAEHAISVLEAYHCKHTAKEEGEHRQRSQEEQHPLLDDASLVAGPPPPTDEVLLAAQIIARLVTADQQQQQQQQQRRSASSSPTTAEAKNHSDSDGNGDDDEIADAAFLQSLKQRAGSALRQFLCDSGLGVVDPYGHVLARARIPPPTSAHFDREAQQAFMASLAELQAEADPLNVAAGEQSTSIRSATTTGPAGLWSLRGATAAPFLATSTVVRLPAVPTVNVVRCLNVVPTIRREGPAVARRHVLLRGDDSATKEGASPAPGGVFPAKQDDSAETERATEQPVTGRSSGDSKRENSGGGGGQEAVLDEIQSLVRGLKASADDMRGALQAEQATIARSTALMGTTGEKVARQTAAVQELAGVGTGAGGKGRVRQLLALLHLPGPIADVIASAVDAAWAVIGTALWAFAIVAVAAATLLVIVSLPKGRIIERIHTTAVITAGGAGGGGAGDAGIR